MSGSEFSYEDVSLMTTLESDFKVKIINQEKQDGEECNVIELVPKDKSKTSYNKLIGWFDKELCVMRKINFYKNNKLNKSILQQDYKKKKGFMIAYTMIMKSLKNNSETKITIEKVEINPKIKDSLFNKNSLDR